MFVIFIRIANDYEPINATDAQRHRQEIERLVRDIVCVTWQRAAKMHLSCTTSTGLAGTTHVTTFVESEVKP